MAESTDFIRDIVARDIAEGKIASKVVTRFPPEPNGYLHIGHAKSICLNFGVAQEFGGRCHLRMDDTNPEKESVEYETSIRDAVKWLGFTWGENQFHASDYFDRLHALAVELIRRGKAYVCDLTADQTREYRGTLTEPGKESPFRNRTVEENLDLFERMRQGEFPDGTRVLRARIDMASPNVVMRDPTLYRIRHAHHHRTGDKWCVYPMYDYTHCLSDSIEGITHSLCTLEFENNRPLYDWVLDQLEMPCHPQQIEFARLNLTYTVMSKRKLLTLVEENHVEGWDDPRMPTLVGMRRRGFPAEAIRQFCEKIGVARKEGWIDYAFLEDCVRTYLNVKAPRVMAVTRPLKVVLENYPEDLEDSFDVPYHPDESSRSDSRAVPFSKVLYIENDDFMEDPPAKYFRLSPGREVRLRRAYIIKCERAIKDPVTGQILELRCTYDPATKGGDAPDGRKVKGTIHWVSARHAVLAQVRLFDRLFSLEKPGTGDDDFRTQINKDSLEVVDAFVEASLATASAEDHFQFERIGYFSVDPKLSKPGAPVFNRIVALRDGWSKIVQAEKK